MFCDDNEGVNTPNAEDRPGLSTQDWAKNIRNHTFPNFKHSETWSEEGLSFYAVLIVWFMVSNWEHVSLRLMYANPSHVSSSWFLL